MNKFLFILLLCTETAYSFSWHHQIVDVKSKTSTDFSALAQLSRDFDYIAIGEKHNTAEVQILEGKLIKELSAANSREHVLAWEFLAHTEGEKNKKLFKEFLDGKITAADFLTVTVNKTSASFYAPVLETIKSLNIDLIGLNLTRAEKAPVTKGGIEAADPNLVPPGFELGGIHYFERFKEAMGEHTPKEQLANYYDAQCLTDDVMAYTLLQQPVNKTYFLIAGSFHTDYFDGTLSRLLRRQPNIRLLSIKLIDASDYREEELMGILHHEKYGPIADFVIFVNEPQVSSQQAIN